jgi:hypothetical protein
MHVSARTYKVLFINKIIFPNIKGIELKGYIMQKRLNFIYFKHLIFKRLIIKTININGVRSESFVARTASKRESGTL